MANASMVATKKGSGSACVGAPPVTLLIDVKSHGSNASHSLTRSCSTSAAVAGFAVTVLTMAGCAKLPWRLNAMPLILPSQFGSFARTAGTICPATTSRARLNTRCGLYSLRHSRVGSTPGGRSTSHAITGKSVERKVVTTETSAMPLRSGASTTSSPRCGWAVPRGTLKSRPLHVTSD